MKKSLKECIEKERSLYGKICGTKRFLVLEHMRKMSVPEEPQNYKEAIYPTEGYCPLYIQCHHCRIVKPIVHFLKRTSLDRLVLKKSCDDCRELINVAKESARNRVTDPSDIYPNYRTCKNCGIAKPITNFHIRRTNLHGQKIRGHVCRSCSTQYGGTGMNKDKKLRVLKRDRYICHYCGKYGDTVDHIIPMSKGGRNGMKNLVCACYDCNQERGDMEYEEFCLLKNNKQKIKGQKE